MLLVSVTFSLLSKLCAKLIISGLISSSILSKRDYITTGAIKKGKSPPRTPLLEFLDENPFSELSLRAKFELRIDQF